MVQYHREGGAAPKGRFITVKLSVKNNNLSSPHSPLPKRNNSCVFNRQAKPATVKRKNPTSLNRSYTTHVPNRENINIINSGGQQFIFSDSNGNLNRNANDTNINNNARRRNNGSSIHFPNSYDDLTIDCEEGGRQPNCDPKDSLTTEMGGGGGRHSHCYTEVHIPPTPHMGVGSLTSNSINNNSINVQNDPNRRFTVSLKPGQYKVNVQWKSRNQPFRITLMPRSKSPSPLLPEGPPPQEQQPLFYCTQAPAPNLSQAPNSTSQRPSSSSSIPSSISSLSKRIVNRLLYKQTSPARRCLHVSKSDPVTQKATSINATVPNENRNGLPLRSVSNPVDIGQSTSTVPKNLNSSCCRKGQKRGWDGGPKVRSRRSRYRLAERKKNEGNELYKKKEYREALKLYNNAIQICPDCAAYYSNRSACYMMLGKYRDALNDALQAVKLDSSFVKGYIRVGKCNIALGDANAALSILKKASELEPNNQGVRDEVNNAQTLTRHLDAIAVAADKKDYRTAIYNIDRALEIAVGCKTLKTTKAEYLAFLGRYNESQDIATEILLIESTNVDALFVRGLCLYYLDNLDSAFTHFQYVLKLAPDHQKAKDTYKKGKQLKLKKDEGNQAFNKGSLAQALKLYSEALSIDPNMKLINAKLYFNRATVSFRLNNLEGAVSDCTAAINLDDTYQKAYLRRAKCYQSLEKHEEAVRDFEKLFKLDHSSHEYKRLLQDAKHQLKLSKRKDYYKILGITKSATDDEIKKSYKKKALIYHPDRHASASEKEKQENEIKFKEIGEAYAILTDPKKRSMYDRGQDINDGMFNAEDDDPTHIFQSFFGGGGEPFFFHEAGSRYPDGFSDAFNRGGVHFSFH